MKKKKEEIIENNAKCIAAIESRKRELDEMIRNVSDHTPEVTETIDENVKTMDGFLTNLEDIRKSNTTTYENVREKLESVAEIERCFQMILTNESNFEYYEFSGNSDLQKLKLTEKRDDSISEQTDDTDKTIEVDSKDADKHFSEKEDKANKVSERETDDDYVPKRRKGRKRRVIWEESDSDTSAEEPRLKKMRK